MEARKPISTTGYRSLQEELTHLIKVERPAIVHAIEVARAHGDLKENAEYHAAKEKQGFVEGRIQRINFILANSDVIDVSKTKADSIRFGAYVSYENMDTEELTSWQIVGEEETNFEQGKISIASPIARALIGKKVGDEVKIIIPKGNVEVEIISFEYK